MARPRGDWKPLQYTASGHIKLPVLQFPAEVHAMLDHAESGSRSDSADDVCHNQPWLETPTASSDGSEPDLQSSSTESSHSFSSERLTESADS